MKLATRVVNGDACSKIHTTYLLLLVTGLLVLVLYLIPSPSYTVLPFDRLASNDAAQSQNQAFWLRTPDNNDLLSHLTVHEINTRSFDLSQGDVRIFQPHGLASHFFIHVGTYRSNARQFSTVGLISHQLNEVRGRSFECEWVSQGLNSTVTKGKVRKIQPDFVYVRVYGTLVLSCSLDKDVGLDREGGSLWVIAKYGDGFRPDEKFIALTEAPGEYNASKFEPPYPYEYVYCGSPLYGNISPQRTREWIAYHAHLFGGRSHFILYDGGGLHEEVYKVLRPWIKQGRITVQNTRAADIYEGYYHHQFTLANDCMLRAQFMANWTFFFDLDEYLFVNTSTTLAKILEQSEKENATQVQWEPVNVEHQTCLLDSTVDVNTYKTANAKKWMMEKLVFAWKYRWPIMANKKYAIKSRQCWATGVHKSEDLKEGNTRVLNPLESRYYHYHGTLNHRREICTEFATASCTPDYSHLTSTSNASCALGYYVRGKDNYTTDLTMTRQAAIAMNFEKQAIGDQPFLL